MFRARAKSLPSTPVEYPIGTFIETEKGYFYIATPAKRYRLLSERVLVSWRPHRLVKTTEAAVQRYRISAKMKFRNGSLLYNLADGKLYLVEEGKRRHITNPDVFPRIGATTREAVTVSQTELNLHELGEELR